jgi:hypothetical protein
VTRERSKPLRVQSFMVALFNVGLGFTPVVETDESGRFVYIFPGAVRSAEAHYTAAKDKLTMLQRDCLRRTSEPTRSAEPTPSENGGAR